VQYKFCYATEWLILRIGGSETGGGRERREVEGGRRKGEKEKRGDHSCIIGQRERWIVFIGIARNTLLRHYDAGGA